MSINEKGTGTANPVSLENTFEIKYNDLLGKVMQEKIDSLARAEQIYSETNKTIMESNNNLINAGRELDKALKNINEIEKIFRKSWSYILKSIILQYPRYFGFIFCVVFGMIILVIYCKNIELTTANFKIKSESTSTHFSPKPNQKH